MRITMNKNSSLNLFGISRTKAESLMKALYQVLSKKPKRDFPVMDMFDLRMLEEILTELEKHEEQIWK